MSNTWIIKFKQGGLLWTRAADQEVEPPGRKLSSMVYNSDRHSMIVFGGVSSVYYNDVWELHLEDGEENWEALPISGIPPEPRDGHMVAIFFTSTI